MLLYKKLAKTFVLDFTTTSDRQGQKCIQYRSVFFSILFNVGITTRFLGVISALVDFLKTIIMWVGRLHDKSMTGGDEIFKFDTSFGLGSVSVPKFCPFHARS